MVLLNQASSNFSPRVLPGLISNKRHQKILGIYNATLLYCIFTLVQIEPNQEKFQLPGFSVLLAIGFMTVCLGHVSQNSCGPWVLKQPLRDKTTRSFVQFTVVDVVDIID